ncbi:uncharacterized protein LOC130775611 [Actinidia eriantha]|uniref:uncharacterized protein LOC130775611 n=1 Tax=Actinidia eriantha TaxID=165200 RepID=UPI0025848260|nr:uncharacterized protein LOC130775611 [Actinidia eriantha]
MAEREQKAGYPLAPSNGYGRSDEEAMNSDELRRQKRKKWALYIIAFVIFQTGIIVLFTFTVMKFRTPKFRMRPASSFDTFDVQTTTPLFNLRMNAQFGIKNTNSAPLSTATPPSISTIKVNVQVNLVMPASLASNSELANDLNTGILPLTSQSRVNGKVEIMFIFKKKRSANLNCTMEVNTSTKSLQNVKCK